jgi:hypothetical protein
MPDFPLPAPQNEDELAKNLQIMQADLGLSKEEIYQIAHDFATGKPLPSNIGDNDKGYIFTILYLLTGGKTEVELWEEKAAVLADNLNYFIESEQLSLSSFLNDLRFIAQKIVSREEVPALHLHSPMADTFATLTYFIQTAIFYEPTALATLAMLGELMKAGQQNIDDLIAYLRDAIIVGIEEVFEDEDADEE